LALAASAEAALHLAKEEGRAEVAAVVSRAENAERSLQDAARTWQSVAAAAESRAENAERSLQDARRDLRRLRGQICAGCRLRLLDDDD